MADNEQSSLASQRGHRQSYAFRIRGELEDRCGTFLTGVPDGSQTEVNTSEP